MRRMVWIAVVLAVAVGLPLAHQPTQARSLHGSPRAGTIPQPKYPAYTKQVTIKWWGWTTNPQNVIAAFEKQYPSIHVVREEVGAGTPEYTKMLTAIKAGSGAPDLVQLAISVLPQFAATGGLRDLAPLGANLYKPYFLPWTWNQVTQGNSIYAIPEDSGPMALFYNTTIFQKYGLTVPRTWDQYLADAAKLHKANPKIFMTNFSPTDGEWFLGMAWANGARPFSQTGTNSWRINLTSAPILKVANLWDALLKNGYAEPSPSWGAEWTKNLAGGVYATLIGCAWSPSYEIGPFVKPGSGWRVAPLPQWSLTAPFDDGNWGGSVNAVSTQSANPAAALLFAGWLNTNATAIHYAVLSDKLGGRGLWPAGEYALNTPALQAPDPILGGQKPADVFIAASRAVDTRFQWSPWTTYMNNVYGVQIGKAIAGQQSWAQALATTEQSVIRYAQQQGYSATH